MKKTFIALLITTIFTMSACNDQEKATLIKKLQDSEHTISQLTAQVAKNKEDIPILAVEILSFFDKNETLQFEKDPNDHLSREQSHIYVSASIPSTKIEWLDNLLIKEILAGYLSEEEHQNKESKDINSKALLTKKLTEIYQGFLEEAKEIKPIALINTVESFYIGQRNNILTFSLLFNSYTGGAHGIYSTQFINIDINKKSAIQFNDLFTQENQTQLIDLLWAEYEDRSLISHRESKPFVSKTEFFVSNNIYFSEKGINFVYAPYDIGSFAEGEITLTLHWNEINPLLNLEYQRTKKDGFGLIEYK